MADIFFDEASFSTALLDTVGALIVVLDAEGQILSFNRTCEELTGYTQAEIQGSSIDRFLINKELPGVRHVIERILSSKERVQHQNYWVTKSGELKFIEWSNLGLKGKDGQVRFVLATGIDVTERNKKEKALRESEKRFGSLFRSSPVPILIARAADCHILDINPIFEQLTGFSREELVGTNLKKTGIIEIADVTLCTSPQVSRSKKPITYEFKIHDKSGRTFDMIASVVQINLGGEICFLATLQDISEQKAYAQKILKMNDDLEQRVNERTVALESQIQQSMVLQQKLNELMRINPVVIVSTQPFVPFTITYISENVETIFGYHPKEMMNVPFRWREIVHPDDAKKAPDVVRALETTSSVSTEFLLRRADGQYRNVLQVASLIRDVSGNPVEIHFSLQDITAQREYEHEIREREELYRSLAESAQDFISVIGKDGMFTYVNAHGAKLFDLQPEDMVGKLREEFFSNEQSNEQRKALDKFFIEDQVLYYDEAVSLPGGTSWFGTRMMPIHGINGEVKAVLEISRDITARKQAENELRNALRKEKELNELQSNFISMITHQFGTPLSTILSSAEMLAEYGENWTGDRRTKHHQRIIVSAKRIDAMMQDILELGRADGASDRVNFQPVDLVALCSSVVDSFQIADQGHQFQFSGPETPIICQIDEHLIVYSLENLLTNAMKYSAEGTTIEVSLWLEGDRILVRIKDQGMGISQQDLNLVGTKFYRARNVSRIPGTGLGLAFVKRSMEAMQGTFEIRSQEKVGTEVDLRLAYLPAVMENENTGGDE